MKAEYIELLPSYLKDLVRETENHIGFEIDVVVDAGCACRVSGEVAHLACEIEKDAALLLIPSAGLFPPGAVFHELLHIRRFLVEEVPCLVDSADYEAWTPEMGASLTYHDNAFEHLVIVPQELKVFPERRADWENKVKRLWAKIEAGEGSDIDRRQASMACWAFLRLVMPDSPNVDIARSVLADVSAFEHAEQFYEALVPVLGDKDAAVRVWFAHQGIPLEMASLKYFDPQNLHSWEIPLIQHNKKGRSELDFYSKT